MQLVREEAEKGRVSAGALAREGIQEIFYFILSLRRNRMERQSAANAVDAIEDDVGGRAMAIFGPSV